VSKVNLVWSTPDGENLLGYMARVSNPKATKDDPSSKLLNYLIEHEHWSPFEMVNVCMEIHTTRDIARQILRHRSFSFQEFSQRYAEAQGFEFGECRMQDEKNRQNSLPCDNVELARQWEVAQQHVISAAELAYSVALKAGIAKEVARKVLPEGLTLSKMYMNGSLRSWMHFIKVRTDPSTQKEHREIAKQCRTIVLDRYPSLATHLLFGEVKNG
jgi:thymidylate synthase (FAD)